MNEHQKKIKRFFSNTIMLYIVQISNFVFPLITFPYLTRVLGTETYGIVVFTNAVMTYFQTFVEFGFLLSATKECSLSRDNITELQEIVSSVIGAKFLLTLAGFLVLVGLVLSVPSFKEKSIYILLSYLPVAVNAFLTDYLFRGMEQMQAITVRMLSSKIVYTLLIFLIVKNKTDYLWIPIITALGNTFAVMWTWHYVIKEWKIKLQIQSCKKIYVALKESAQFFLSRIASTAYSSSNVVVLGLFFSDAAMGVFGTANNLISNARLMFGPIADSIYPYMIKERNYKLIKIIMLVLMPFIIMGTVLLYVFAEPFITFICGQEFRESYRIFRIMLPLIVLALPSYLLGYPVLGAMNKMKEANQSVIIAAIFHISGLLILILLQKLTFVSVSILTIVTESLVLLMRIGFILFGAKREG